MEKISKLERLRDRYLSVSAEISNFIKTGEINSQNESSRSYERDDSSYEGGRSSCEGDDSSYERGRSSYERDDSSYERGRSSYEGDDSSYEKDDRSYENALKSNLKLFQSKQMFIPLMASLMDTMKDASNKKLFTRKEQMLTLTILMMGMHYDEWLPDAEIRFFPFQNTLMAALVVQILPLFGANQEITSAFTNLLQLQTNYVTAYIIAGLDKLNTRNRVQVASKNYHKKLYIAGLRTFYAAYIRNSPLITPELRVAMGTPVYDNIKTPIAPPITIPFGKLIALKGSLMKVHFEQEPGAEGAGKKGMPDGVFAVKAYYFIGTAAPVNYKTCPSQILTESGQKIQCNQQDAGKLLFVCLTYINAKQQEGPIGEWLSEYILK